MSQNQTPSEQAVIKTSYGEMTIAFWPDVAPKTVENFKNLARKGFYDGTAFHRIIKGFMIQGGDPAGNGTGGESAWGGRFPDEIKRSSPLYQAGYRRGIVAMANSGPDTNGSQFFIMHQDYPLPPSYVIFAKVTRGMDVVDALASTPTTAGPDGEASKPVIPPKLQKVTILP
jgi:cyclophilin family peptidyl-prolyl cis-trans isomerase